MGEPCFKSLIAGCEERIVVSHYSSFPYFIRRVTEPVNGSHRCLEWLTERNLFHRGAAYDLILLCTNPQKPEHAVKYIRRFVVSINEGIQLYGHAELIISKPYLVRDLG